MTQKKRRFFSGPSLPAALVAAASEHGLQPEEIEYRIIEKKHGFLKVRRNVVIEVDPESPKKTAVEKPAAPARREARQPEEAVVETGVEGGGEIDVEELPQLRPRRRPDRGDRDEEQAPPRERRGREQRPGRKKREPEPAARQRFAATPAGDDRRERARDEPKRQAAPRTDTEPEEQRREKLAPVEERNPRAAGPLAEGALEAIEWLLDLVDLDLDPTVYEGDERFEIELRGNDRDILIADNGKALAALEHLVPRVMRGVCGEVYPCRVDSENYQLLREEHLRATARKVASRVGREGRPEILEPMDPSDRRIIHVELSEDPSVTTRSLGDGFFKRIKVLPAD